MNRAAPIEVREATADSWPDVEQLFGRAGASNGCWCQYWLLGADYTRRDRTQNQIDLQTQIHRGGAGLVAYRDGEPVGWTRFTPRTDRNWLLDRFAKYDFGPDDAWSLSCFFVARRARGQGVMTTLIDYATSWGHGHDTVIEAYPIHTTVHAATRNAFPGILQTFLNAGFSEQGRLARDRAVVVSGQRQA